MPIIGRPKSRGPTALLFISLWCCASAVLYKRHFKQWYFHLLVVLRIKTGLLISPPAPTYAVFECEHEQKMSCAKPYLFSRARYICSWCKYRHMYDAIKQIIILILFCGYAQKLVRFIRAIERDTFLRCESVDHNLSTSLRATMNPDKRRISFVNAGKTLRYSEQ